jgi:leucyl/phenylalanyl-tRNA--protein transferase
VQPGHEKSRLRELDPPLLLRAYAAGLFPMADTRESPDIFWVEPRRRGILPLDMFHMPRSLARTLRRETFTHAVDRAFEEVIGACASAAPGREQTWINYTILAAYVRLHREGHAHSVETYDAHGRLVGGLYGVRLGAAFFGESMFSRATDASKAALAHLVARLRAGGFRLLDTQFLTAHLARLGGVEVKRSRYLSLLSDAVATRADWHALDRRLALQSPSAAGAASWGGEAAGVAAAAAGARGALAGRAATDGRCGPSGKAIVQLLSHTS